ncbi:MAG: sodium:calcium exchanger [Maritimibacter sp.]|nr:sodium:calcium exchanger [Maritimibacter sp.]
MPTPVVTIAGDAQLEYGYITFTIDLSEAPTDAVTIDYQLLDGTALLGSSTGRDVSEYSSYDFEGQITFAPGDMTQTLTFFVRSDSIDEIDEYVELQLFDPDGARFGGGRSTLSAISWALDDDGAGLNQAIAVTDVTISESANKAVFTVSLSQAFGSTQDFTWSTFNGSARAGEDYTADSGIVSFAPGQTEAVIEIDITDDTRREITEQFGLRIDGSAGLTGTTATATIEDNDTNQPVVSVFGDANLEYGYITYTVRLSEAPVDAVTIGYQLLPGTALLGTSTGRDVSGYSSYDLSGEITFAPGDTTETLTFFIRSDSTDEIDESVQLELFDPNGATFGGGNQTLTATGWALDDDGVGLNRAIAVTDVTIVEDAGKAVFKVSLSEAFDTAQSFDWSTFDGTAKAGEDYKAKDGTLTFAAGQTEAFITVNLKDDNRAEITEQFGVKIDGAANVDGTVGTAKIEDDDGPLPVVSVEGDANLEYGYITYTIRLSEAPSDAVTVDYQLLDGTALIGTSTGNDVSGYGSYGVEGTISFAPGETTQTVTFFVRSDSTDEIDENVLLQLHDPVGATFGGGNQTLTAIGWALDDDGVGLNRSIAVSDVKIEEYDGKEDSRAVFTVEISEPSDTAITLDYSTFNGTAKAGKDYIKATGSITFAPGQTKAFVEVTVLSDIVKEGTETFGLSITPPFPAEIASGLTSSTGTARIVDDAILGTKGNDVLRGTAGDDRIDGLAGNDKLFGRAGRDALYGGDGKDELHGDKGHDLLFGEGGNDKLWLDDGNDKLNGGKGTDTIIVTGTAKTVIDLAVTAAQNTGHGNDRIVNVENVTGGNGVDVLSGNAADNALVGKGGRDKLFGRNGDDALDGGKGNDLLDGGKGDDLLKGLDGNDKLIAGAGRDTMIGGDGSDTFVFTSGKDVIRDFDATDNLEDVDLSGVASITSYTDLVNNHMTQVGSDVVIDALDGNTLILKDVNIAQLHQADFLF